MTTSREFVIRCNGCHDEDTWSLEVFRHTRRKTLIKNAGYSIETTDSLWDDTEHYCPRCNDREKDTFHVYDGHGEEYLGPVEAWGIIQARRVAYEEFGRDRMVTRERLDP